LLARLGLYRKHSRRAPAHKRNSDPLETSVRPETDRRERQDDPYTHSGSIGHRRFVTPPPGAGGPSITMGEKILSGAGRDSRRPAEGQLQRTPLDPLTSARCGLLASWRSFG
jgi:hypothetical protein